MRQTSNRYPFDLERIGALFHIAEKALIFPHSYIPLHKQKQPAFGQQDSPCRRKQTVIIHTSFHGSPSLDCSKHAIQWHENISLSP